MNTEERSRLIESYGDAYRQLTEALNTFPTEVWQYKPSPERWSTHEIIVHIADSEANSYVRVRRGIAEPGSQILGYDQDGWAIRLNYHDQSTEDYLQLFRWLRHTTYQLIRNQPEGVWAHTYVHSDNGPTTLDAWLKIYEHHVHGHIEQMQKNYEHWKQRQ
jgi:hypothetical protein